MGLAVRRPARRCSSPPRSRWSMGAAFSSAVSLSTAALQSHHSTKSSPATPKSPNKDGSRCDESNISKPQHPRPLAHCAHTRDPSPRLADQQRVDPDEKHAAPTNDTSPTASSDACGKTKATPQPAPATSRLTRERLTVPAGRVGLVRNEEPLVGFGQLALDGAVGVGLLGVGLVALERVEAQRAWMSRQARCSATPRSSSSSLFTSGARNTNMLRNWRWPLLRVRAASALLLAQAMRCRGWRAPCSVRALPVGRRHRRAPQPGSAGIRAPRRTRLVPGWPLGRAPGCARELRRVSTKETAQ